MDRAIHVPHNRLPLIALLTANTVSMVGNVFTSLSVPWFVLVTTGSVTKTGLTGAVTALSFAASFFGGALVDRLGFKRVAVATDLASGIAVALIPLLYHTIGLAYGQLLALVFMRALFNTPGGTARSGLLPDLITLAGVSRERANGANQSLLNGAELAGTAGVGVLIALIGASNMLWLDGVSFLFSAAMVALIVPASMHVAVARPRRKRGTYVRELAEGWHFLLHDRLLWTLRLTAMSVNFFGAAMDSVLLPVYAKQVYRSSVSLGLLFAGFSVGTLASTLLYTALAPRLSRRVAFVSGIVLIGVPFLLLALHLPLWVAVIALFAVGMTIGPVGPIFMGVQQERVPVALRGRVFGAGQALGNIATPVGALVAGYLVAALGLRGAIVVMAVFLIGTGVWVASNRILHDMDRKSSD